jgi:hypothetical protein
MRDPRYELGRVSLRAPCIAFEETMLELAPPPGATGELTLVLEALGEKSEPILERKLAASGRALEVSVGRLKAGGYGARLSVGAAPPLRFDFACEAGGGAFADSRPDPERLARIARASDGKSVAPDGVSSLPEPPAIEITLERHASPLLPPWAWTLAAAVSLGAHWIFRRQRGLP